MKSSISKRTLTQAALLTAGLLALQPGLFAQGRGGRGGGPPQAPKAAAPIDLTGYWVAVVTEDWRYRMVIPAKGDYEGVPMTPAAIKVADSWELDKEAASPDQCKAYGAPTLLRNPGRLHITWQDDNTLKLETDAGQQTRVFHFGAAKAPEGAPSLQGNSVASWETQRAGGKPVGGSLKVDTTDLKAGFLRKNGVPYSDKTTLTEYYDIVKERNGDTLLVVTTVTTDPMYLREPFIITTHFKKQMSEAGWKPTPCSAKW